MGRHAAADDAAVHPLVAAALARRAAVRGSGADPRSTEGDVGWPAPPAREGGGLGWPGDLPADLPDEARTPQPRRRGLRRLFGLRRTA